MKLVNSKTLLIFLLVSSFSSVLKSQNSFWQDVMRSSGWSFIYGNYMMTPVSETGDAMIGTNFLGYEYGMRYNFLTMGDNASLSVGLYPSLKATFLASIDEEAYKFGEASIPLLFGINLGNISTWDSFNTKGFGLEIGLDFKRFLISVGEDTRIESNYNSETSQWEETETEIKHKSGYVQFLTNLGYRYWSKNDRAIEFALKLGWTPKADESLITGDDFLELSGGRGLSFEFSYKIYMNY